MTENYSSATPKPFVFVLMPFDKKFDDIYKLGIKGACQEAGAYCERVDEQLFTESILDHIYNQISKADIVVADMTGRNPNVFYETGYAHAMGKPVILLTQNVDDIPFDMKHYPHIIYGNSISGLKGELEKRIIWCIQNPKQKLGNTGFDLEYSLWGVSLYKVPLIEFPFTTKKISESRVQQTFNFEIYNPSNFVVDGSNLQLGLVLPFGFEVFAGSSIRLNENPVKIMYILPPIGKVLPKGWLLVPFILPIDNIKGFLDKTYEGSLRIFTEIGIKEFPFKLRFLVKSITVTNSDN